MKDCGSVGAEKNGRMEKKCVFAHKIPVVIGGPEGAGADAAAAAAAGTAAPETSVKNNQH